MSRGHHGLQKLLLSTVLLLTLTAGHAMTTVAAPASTGQARFHSIAQIEPNPDDDDPQSALDAAAMQEWIDGATAQASTFGPAEGTLTQKLGRATIGDTGVDLPDFYASAIFTNPENADVWDLGFGFRSDDTGAHYRLKVQSTGAVIFTSVGTQDSSVGMFSADQFDTAPGAENQVELVISGETGYLAINSVFVSALNLSVPMAGSDLFIGTGFDADWVTEGASVGYSAFEIWSLAGVTAPVVATLTAEQTSPNAQLVRDFYDEMYNSDDTDNIGDYLSSDFVMHNPPPQRDQALDDYLATTAEGVAALHQAFPDLDYTIEDLIVSGDTVVARVVFTGTQTGALGTIPATGKAIQVEEITIFKIVDDEFTEAWTLTDQLGLLVQLGVSIGS